MNKQHHSRSRRRRRRPRRTDLPKGAFRLPSGGVATKIVYTDQRGRRIAIIGVRREKPDLELLAKALVQIALNKVAAELEREHLDPAA